MPSDPAAALSALLRSTSIQDHEEILKAANAAIKANKSDIDTQHTRIVALLHLDRFDDALRSIDEGGTKLDAVCSLEKAYALYKTGKLEEATTVLKSVGLKDRSFKHVAAQVAYRAERFDEVDEIYQRLSGEEADGEDNDLNINRRAATAQAEWNGTAPSFPSDEKHPETFEVCYNVACSHIARGSFEHAATLLQGAARLCDASDELSAEDKEAEMQPILAQQAYVYAKLGKVKKSLDLYNSLGQAGDNDPDLALVIENNRAALQAGSENPFLVQRKAESWGRRSQDAKLFNYQSSLLNRNGLIIDLKAQKVDGVGRRTQKALSQAFHPSISSSLGSLSVLNAVANTHGTDGKEATRAIQELSRKRPDDIGLVLTLVQRQIKEDRHGAALATLESFLSQKEEATDVRTTDARFSPGLVALVVSLMRHQGSETSAKNELAKATKYWQQRPAGPATSLLREAGIELLRSSNAEDLQLAGSAFEKLFAESRGSHIDAAGLVASLAPSDPERAEQFVSELPAVDELINDIDVEKLIESGVTTVPKSNAALKRSAPPDDGGEKKAAAKRRRTRKLPKNYVEGKTPDPERWLPLRDRSSYKPKGRKGKKKMAESTQGGMVKEEETLELVGGGGVKVEKAAPSGNSNKKKKKGKK